MSASTGDGIGDSTGDSTAAGWETELERYLTQRELFAQLQETVWVPLAQAESEAGVSRSALRAWFRAGEIPSRLVDSPHGPQRIVPLDAVLDRAARSPRLRRRAERDQGLAQEVAALRQRLAEVEDRLAQVEERGGRR